MAFVSMAEYAKMHGTSKQSATKWKARGCLKIVDGKIDVEASDRIMMHAGLGRFAERSTSTAPTPSTVNRQPGKPPVGLAADLTEAIEDQADLPPGLISFVNNLAQGHHVDLITAQTIKENGLALLRLIEARKRAGEVIELADAEGVVFEMFRLQRDAWLNFPSRVGPLIAADLGLSPERVAEVLTAHVHQQLSDLGEPGHPLRQDGQAAPDSAAGMGAAASAKPAGLGGSVS